MNDVGHAPLPGDVLLHQYLQPNNITIKPSGESHEPATNHHQWPDTGKDASPQASAYQLAYVLGTSPEYWLELQMNYDIENYDKFDESGLTVPH